MEVNSNLLLTEREGRTGEYWPEVEAVRPSRTAYAAVRPSRVFTDTEVNNSFNKKVSMRLTVSRKTTKSLDVKIEIF